MFILTIVSSRSNFWSGSGMTIYRRRSVADQEVITTIERNTFSDWQAWKWKRNLEGVWLESLFLMFDHGPREAWWRVGYYLTQLLSGHRYAGIYMGDSFYRGNFIIKNVELIGIFTRLIDVAPSGLLTRGLTLIMCLTVTGLCPQRTVGYYSVLVRCQNLTCRAGKSPIIFYNITGISTP